MPQDRQLPQPCALSGFSLHMGLWHFQPSVMAGALGLDWPELPAGALIEYPFSGILYFVAGKKQ